MNGYIFYYKGTTRKSGTVGLVLNSKWKDNIQGFTSHSDRVISVQMNFNKNTLGIVQCYAPTTTHPDLDVLQFYDQVFLWSSSGAR